MNTSTNTHSSYFDYQRALNMRLDKLNKLKGVERGVERDSFFRSPDFDISRFNSMLEYTRDFINNADFSYGVVYFFPPIDDIFFSKTQKIRVHPWRTDNCEQYTQNTYIPNTYVPNKYVPNKYVPNKYVKYVLEKVEESGFSVYPNKSLDWRDIHGFKIEC